MDKNFRFALLVLAMNAFAGCSILQRSAINTSAKVIYQASEEIETEANWELFKQAVPGNLKLLEGLLHLHPKSEALLVSLIKGYVGYAFAVHETLALEEELSRSYRSVHKQQAVAMYSKAVRYGYDFLQLRGITELELTKAIRKDNGVSDLLNKNITAKKDLDREAIFFLAQALGSLINLQRDDMVLVSQLPVAKSLFDWVCLAEPDIHFGACDLFYGAYEAGRPAMLGGNPELGKTLFEKAIQRHPENWLIPLSFLQHYALPQYDEAVYQNLKKRFEVWLEEFEALQRWRPGQTKAAEFRTSRLNLYRAIALKRYQIIKQHEKSLF